MLTSKWRQVGFGLGTPSATLGYPLQPLSPDPHYRGRVVVDTDRCVGCGGCALVCPARCITVEDPSRDVRVIRRHLGRCILCGRCADACAYEAVRLEADWETGTPDRQDLEVEQRLYMGVCDRCGRCYVPAHPLDRLIETGLLPPPENGAPSGNRHRAGAAARDPAASEAAATPAAGHGEA
jgi:ferredoxin